MEHTASTIRRSIISVTMASGFGIARCCTRAYTIRQTPDCDPRHSAEDFVQATLRREAYVMALTEGRTAECAQCPRCDAWVVITPRSAERIDDGSNDGATATIQITCPNPDCTRRDFLPIVRVFCVKSDKTRTFPLPRHIIERGYFFESELIR